MDDPFNLKRYVSAQAGVFEHAAAELRAGRKRSHWMWFVFPQIAGLGRSDMARFYAISSAAEARAYLAHPVLGPRLRECCGMAKAVQGRSAYDIFGDPDEMKFRSCLTLFGAVAPEETVFAETLERFFPGRPDRATLDRLLATGHPPQPK